MLLPPLQLLVLKIQQQEVLIQSLVLTVEKQSKEIAVLTAKLREYENPKNSSNSSIPRSKDENRPAKNQSLRSPSAKKRGGQSKHKGFTFEYTTIPDEVIDHKPQYCNRCVGDLSAVSEDLIEGRRVVDLPVIKRICTEHNTYCKTCICVHCTEANFLRALQPVCNTEQVCRRPSVICMPVK